jgi:hypothetical protein
MNLLSQRHSQRLPRLRIERTQIGNKIFFQEHPGAADLGAGHHTGASQLAQGFGVDLQELRTLLKTTGSHGCSLETSKGGAVAELVQLSIRCPPDFHGRCM